MSQKNETSTTQTFVVLDDHEVILGGTLALLKESYPDVQVVTAQTSQEALAKIKVVQPQLVMMDLAVPEQKGGESKVEHGIELLRLLMKTYPELNIVVQSAHAKTLVRLKPVIDDHEGGFTIANKSSSVEDLMKKVDWASQGLLFTPKEMRHGLELKPVCLSVLQLAFDEGLQDRAIAQRLNVAERTVRHYWTKIQDVLSVYPEEGHNIRIQTQIRAREEGLID